ncbi:MAG: Mpo1-like protein [Burkholderiaceae bacterium]
MNPGELLRWQWEGYPKYHAAKLNLLIHIVAVPGFLVGNLLLVLMLAEGQWGRAAGALLLMAVSFLAQGVGHAKETHPAEPFTSPLNAIGRIFLEQWVTFPRFVLTGGWGKALRTIA